MTPRLLNGISIVTDGPEALPLAAPVVAAQVIRLVQVQKYSATVTCMNTFHFATETGSGSGAGLVADWAANIVPTWKANVQPTMTFTECYAQQILPTADAVTSAAVSGAGTATGNLTAPCPTAGVITWRTQLIGRRRRGRTYVPGLVFDTGSFGNGITWSTVQQTRLQNIGNAILTRYTLGGNPGGYFLVVYSRKTWSDNPPASWPDSVSMVSRFTVQTYIATMGTRRGSRGI